MIRNTQEAILKLKTVIAIIVTTAMRMTSTNKSTHHMKVQTIRLGIRSSNQTTSHHHAISIHSGTATQKISVTKIQRTTAKNDTEYGANSVVEHYVGNEYNGVIKQPLRENKQVPSQAINLQHLFAQRMKDLKEKHCLQWKSLLDTRFQTQQQHKFYGNQLSMRQDQERLQINQWYQQQLDSIKLQITQRKRVGTKTTAEGANAEVTTQTVESTEDIPKVPKFK